MASGGGKPKLERKNTHGKLGVLRRVFSFKKSTSTTKFEVDASKPRNLDAIPESLVPKLVVGMATDLGYHHEENEDRGVIIDDLLTGYVPGEDEEYYGTAVRKCTYLAVFDGHGGKAASDWASKNLHNYLAKLVFLGNFPDLIGSALHHGFKTNEDLFCEWAKSNNCTAGSCATAVLLKGTDIFCGNAGDSKAMIFNEKNGKAVNKIELNERHGSELKSERARIKAAGGQIHADGSVYGVLFPTRGFGDIDVKADGKPVIIATPAGAGVDDKPCVTLDTSQVTYLVNATDGLWDFAADGAIMEIILDGFKSGKTPEQIGGDLIALARMGGSEDDITTIVARITFA